MYPVILNAVATEEESFGMPPRSPKMKALINEYSEVFRSTLPGRLPPKRHVDHEIITDPNTKPPKR